MLKEVCAADSYVPFAQEFKPLGLPPLDLGNKMHLSFERHPYGLNHHSFILIYSGPDFS